MNLNISHIIMEKISVNSMSYLCYIRFAFFIVLIQEIFQNNQTGKISLVFTYKLSSGELFWSSFVRRPSVCPSVYPSTHILWTFFTLVLQHHWVNFNQTWPNESLNKRDSSLSKIGPSPFSKRRYFWQFEHFLKIFSKNHLARKTEYCVISLGSVNLSLLKSWSPGVGLGHN